jgi:hypothetical protein
MAAVTSCTPGANVSSSYHAKSVALEVSQSVYINESGSNCVKAHAVQRRFHH